MMLHMYLSKETEIEPYTPCLRKDFSTISGVWLEGNVYWLSNGNEKILSSEEVSIHMKEESIHSKARLFQVYIRNHSPFEKKMRLLFLSRNHEVATENLSFVSPLDKVVFHLSGEKMYLLNGFTEEGGMQQTIQPLWTIPTEQIWADKEKGILKYQPMGKGAAASIFALDITVPAQSLKKGSAWVIQDKEKNVLLQLNEMILQKHTSISK